MARLLGTITQGEWRQATSDLFHIESMHVYGLKSDVVPLPHGRFKQFLEDLVPDSVARFLTCGLCGGSFLVAHMCTA
jgi:hypothetical protein